MTGLGGCRIGYWFAARYADTGDDGFSVGIARREMCVLDCIRGRLQMIRLEPQPRQQNTIPLAIFLIRHLACRLAWYIRRFIVVEWIIAFLCHFGVCGECSPWLTGCR